MRLNMLHQLSLPLLDGHVQSRWRPPRLVAFQLPLAEYVRLPLVVFFQHP